MPPKNMPPKNMPDILEKCSLSETNCYPLIIFIVCFIIGIISHIIKIVMIMIDKNKKDKMRHIFEDLGVFIGAFISCTIPMFILINITCNTRDPFRHNKCPENPGWGYMWLIFFPCIACCALSMLMTTLEISLM